MIFILKGNWKKVLLQSCKAKHDVIWTVLLKCYFVQKVFKYSCHSSRDQSMENKLRTPCNPFWFYNYSITILHVFHYDCPCIPFQVLGKFAIEISNRNQTWRNRFPELSTIHFHTQWNYKFYYSSLYAFVRHFNLSWGNFR